MISTKCSRVGGSKKDAVGEGHRAGGSSKVLTIPYISWLGRQESQFVSFLHIKLNV